MSEHDEEEEIREFDDLTPEQIGTEPEEIEKHQGEYVVRKKYPHQYTIQLSAKENEAIRNLQQKFEADSVKELLLTLSELLTKGKKHSHLYIIDVSPEQKKFVEKIRKQYDAEDVKELLLAFSLIAEEEECPECEYPLELVKLCLNCAQCYRIIEEDLNEQLEKLKHEEETEEE